MSVIANPTLTGNELDLARLQVGDGHYRAPFTRKNLLDNWYFVGGGDQQGAGIFPINQKKQTSYSGGIYSIDRWRTLSGQSVSVQSDGIAVSSTASTGRGFIQNIENPSALIGKTVTASVLVLSTTDICFFGLQNQSGTIESVQPSAPGLYTITGVVPSGTTSLYIQWHSGANENSAKLAAMKLELGSEQTLAHLENGVWVLNEIPDYTTQLLRCQRFYRVFTSTSTSTTGYGYSTNPKNLRPEMRATPSTGSFTYDGTTYYYLDANI